MHFIRELIAGNAGSKIGVVRTCAEMAVVEAAQRIKHRTLFITLHPSRVFQIKNRRAASVYSDTLIRGGHIAARPIFRTTYRAAGGVEHYDISGQVFIFAAEAVIHPRTQRRFSAEQVTRIHHQHRRAMDRRIGRHRMQEGNLVRLLANVREKVTYLFTTLTVFFKIPFRTDHTATCLFSATPKSFHVNRLTVQWIELGLVIKRVHVAWATIHKQKNHMLRFRWQRRLLGRKRIGPRRLAVCCHRLIGEETIPRHHSGEC